MNGPTFATLRELLLELGFQDHSLAGSCALFEYPQPDTWVLLRPYADDDVVTPTKLVAIGKLLEFRGILLAERFDALLRERSLAN